MLMNAIQLTPAKRGTIACFPSVATVASYFYTMTRGIAGSAHRATWSSC